jgi:hypothetical protein
MHGTNVVLILEPGRILYRLGTHFQLKLNITFKTSVLHLPFLTPAHLQLRLLGEDKVLNTNSSRSMDNRNDSLSDILTVLTPIHIYLTK